MKRHFKTVATATFLVWTLCIACPPAQAINAAKTPRDRNKVIRTKKPVSIPETPMDTGKSLKFAKTVVITKPGRTLDYHGAKLIWTGPGDCSQKEGQPPMFRILAKNVTIKNAVIVDSPDGIHVRRGNALIENVVFPDVCEDAITMHRGASRTTIRGCFFRDAADKAIQINSGRGHRVVGNTFVDVGQGVRVKPGTRVVFTGNALYHTHLGLHADGKDARADVGNNRLHKVRDRYLAEDSAEIIQIEKDKYL